MSDERRKLASVQRIAEIKSIPEADKICAYRINGWWVVDQVDKYRVGDLVVYCEVDSWIPHNMAPFLSKGKEPRVFDGVVGERLRTIKLRGQVSQGLILPLNVLDEWDSAEHIVVSAEHSYVTEDEDVTDVLGIIKWDAPIPAQLQGQIRGSFPSFIPKTDAERIQNLKWDEIQRATNDEWFVTEKLDGTSCTIYLAGDGDFGVCSRNLNLKETEGNTYWSVARNKDIEQRMRDADLFGYAIQGEIVGPGIQGNKYNLNEYDIYVFNVFDIEKQTYVVNSIDVANQVGLKHVPLFDDSFAMSHADAFKETLLEMAEGKSVVNPKQEREGLVFRSNGNPNVLFKAISNRFLLKSKD